MDETSFLLEKKYGVSRSRSCLCKWLKDFDPPYRDIRQLNEGHHPVVRSHLFTHRGLNYEYQLHLPKLRFAKAFHGVTSFLKMLPRGVPEEAFESALRCSKIKPPEMAHLPHIKHSTRNWWCHQALQALRMARHNRERHAVVEGYFLSCDRNTLATEVPVWHFAKGLGRTVAGHIDILQANFGKIWVLDFKPHAAKENPGKVSTQLSLYARSFAFRTGMDLRNIRCAWFDEEDCYFFRMIYKIHQTGN